MLQIEERISILLHTSSYSHIKAEEWKKILFRIPTDNGKPKPNLNMSFLQLKENRCRRISKNAQSNRNFKT